MPHIKGKERGQMVLIPTCHDGLVSEKSSVRLIDAFMDALDLESHGFTNVVPEKDGAPPCGPAFRLGTERWTYFTDCRCSHLGKKENPEPSI